MRRTSSFHIPRSTFRNCSCLAALLTCLLFASQAEATTYTWNGASATDGNMTNTGNWVGGSAWVSGAHDVVISAQGNWATINNDNAANTGMHSLTYNAGVPTLSLNGNQIAINQGVSPNSIVNNSGNVRQMISPKKGNLADSLVTSKDSPEKKVERLFLTVLHRKPSAKETAAFVKHLGAKDKAEALVEDWIWVLLNSSEFRFNH